MIGGLILAGGRSSRFGREKALVELDGQPLIARVERVLACGASPLAISARAGSAAAAYAAARSLACLADAAGDVDGPLAGIQAGLRWATAQGLEWLVTSPCDTPFLPGDLVKRLGAGLKPGGAVAVTAEGRHPLCALWPVAALETIEAEAGHPPINRLLERIGAAEVSFDDVGGFANLNTREDYASALARRT